MTGFPPRVRRIVEDRAKAMCELCSETARYYQIHHRRPRGMGGSKAINTNGPANALLVCLQCHRNIESDRAAALRFGWLVRQGHNPAQVPVFREGRWVLLDDHGCVIPVKETA